VGYSGHFGGLAIADKRTGSAGWSGCVRWR